MLSSDLHRPNRATSVGPDVAAVDGGERPEDRSVLLKDGRLASGDGAVAVMSGAAPSGERVLTRLMDVVVAVILLVFLSPLMLLIALCVFLFDPGPVIFAHRRIGRGGRVFNCYKFRSMYVGAEARLEALLASDPELRRQWERDQKLAKDPRITPLGLFLRVTSLDELPQLVNVLVGDMSLVGPRPIVAAEMPRYGRFIRSYLSVKPGLTGLWQVTGRSTTTYRRRVATDVYYARSKSLKFDIEIMLATIPAVLAGKGSM